MTAMARSSVPRATGIDPEHEMRHDGFELELRGGPLAGGRARVRDTEVRIAVVREGGHLHLRSEDPASGLEFTGRRIGEYGFSHREEALVWFPAPR
jgi:hypothetical protein